MRATEGLRLLVAIDTYVPARISAALQMHDFCRELIAQGHRPTVVVPATGLGAPWRLDDVDGVEVLRVTAPQTKDVGLVRRAIGEWLLPYALLRGLDRSPLRDVHWEGVIWYSPTIFLGPLVARIKRQHGCRSYLILRDLFPDWAVDAGLMRRGSVYRFFKTVERYQYRVANIIGVQTPANVPLVARDSRGSASIEVLPNWLAAPRRTASTFDVKTSPLAGRAIFVYTGNMGPAQGMDGLIDLAAALKHDDKLGFLFVGRGTEAKRLERRASDEGLSNVLFLDEVAANEVPGILAQSRVGMIALDPRHTTHNIPGKFISYLHAGLPVLARINPGNDLLSIIEAANVGRAVVTTRVEELAAAAVELIADASKHGEMSARAVSLAEREYSPASVVAQVVAGLGPKLP